MISVLVSNKLHNFGGLEHVFERVFLLTFAEGGRPRVPSGVLRRAPSAKGWLQVGHREESVDPMRQAFE